MDWQRITCGLFDLSGFTTGALQECGALAIVPLFRPNTGEQAVLPSELMRVPAGSVRGAVRLVNQSKVSESRITVSEGSEGSEGGISEGDFNKSEISEIEAHVAIAPLHFGVWTGSNRAAFLCGAALVAKGESRLLTDACTVTFSHQAPACRGRSLPALPMALRFEALHLRGSRGSRKLRHGVANLNASANLMLTDPGSLYAGADLDAVASRFELLTGQVGALFFLNGRPAGVEIAPSSEYFHDIWPGLISTGYGLAALIAEKASPATCAWAAPFAANSVTDLRAALFQSRRAGQEALMEALSRVPPQRYEVEETDVVGKLNLRTLLGTSFAGQFVEEDLAGSTQQPSDERPTMLRRLFSRGSDSDGLGDADRRLVYLSLFAKP